MRTTQGSEGATTVQINAKSFKENHLLLVPLSCDLR